VTPPPNPPPPAAIAPAAPLALPDAPATATEPPPYDLAADRIERLSAGTRDLGRGARGVVAEDTFVLVGEAAFGEAALRSSLDLAARALAAYFHDRFRTRPARAISVYLFASAKSYEGYCKRTLSDACISRFGFFLSAERRIVMNAGPGLGTLTHELVHPIVEADFPNAPTWIDEGLASLFEAPALPRAGEIHGVKNWRLPRLVAALESRRERETARIDALFGMSNETFRDDDEDLHYAMARYLCQWLDGRGQLWPFYRAWRDGFAHDPSGAAAFEAVTGLTPAAANPKWTSWVRAL